MTLSRRIIKLVRFSSFYFTLPRFTNLSSSRFQRWKPSICFSSRAPCMLLRIARIFAVRREPNKSLFVLGGETFYGFPFCFLARLPLLPAQRRIALFLPLSCSCFSMPSASRYLCIGATDPSGWEWPSIFFSQGLGRECAKMERVPEVLQLSVIIK